MYFKALLHTCYDLTEDDESTFDLVYTHFSSVKHLSILLNSMCLIWEFKVYATIIYAYNLSSNQTNLLLQCSNAWFLLSYLFMFDN